jgi:hypothetical protein
MEFNIYIKDKEDYKKILIEVPINTGWDFLTKLRLSVENEMQNIKKDITIQYPKELQNTIFFPNPKIDNEKKQIKINKLVEMRNNNKKILNEILTLLQTSDFIICEHCNSKMIKTPVNVRYDKIGNNFVILDKDTNCKWVYLCENCVFALSEESYYFKKQNKELREKLIKEGYTFVPDDFGVYHTLQGYPCIKEKELEDIHIISKRRTFENIRVKGIKNPFIKIIEEYPETGEKVQIR